MKNFKDLLSEVAQPKSPEERAFKDQHKIELIKHPVAPDFVHTGEIPGKTKKERLADVKAGEDEKKYDGGAAAKAKPFKMPRNIDESEESGIDRFSDREVKMAIGIASDKRYAGGNMTGAVAAINKLAKGLSRHPQVAAVLQRQNESKESISFKSLMSKISHSEDLLESPQEEVSMMMKQLNFICYASEEIQEYLEIDGLDPEEWWQSKLAQVFSQVKSLYAYAKGNEITNKAIDLDKDDVEGDDDDVMDTDLEAGYINSGMYEEVEEFSQITEKFDLSESKIDVDFVGSDSQKASQEKRFNVKISMHGDGQAFVSGEPRDVWKFAVSHYGDADDAADVHKGLAKSVGVKTESLEKKSSLIEANFKPGNIRLKNGQSVKLDFKDVKALNAMMKGLNPKNRKEMETNMMKDKKGFGEILKFATQAGV